MDKLQKAKLMMEVQGKINREEHLPMLVAGLMANAALNHFDERLLPALDAWLRGEPDLELSVEGNRVADLQEEMGCGYFIALCFLNALLGNPDFGDQIMYEWEDSIV